MPSELAPGILYVSEEFKAAAHLCACGCGAKIRTPLTPTEWLLEITDVGPTLRPSVGNWQLPCKSHYWIIEGEVNWSSQWTPEQILEGRRQEIESRSAYYEDKTTGSLGWFGNIWAWMKRIFEC